MLGQAADVAHRLSAAPLVLWRRPWAIRLRLDRRDRNIVQPECQLSRIALEPLRSRAIQRPLQNLHHGAQLAVLVAQLGDDLDQRVGLARQRSDLGGHAVMPIEPQRRFARVLAGVRVLIRRHRHRATGELHPIHAAEQQS
jgi:hypothetical protein